MIFNCSHLLSVVVLLTCILSMPYFAQNQRTIIVITDNEPDDIMALHLLAATFESDDIDCIGTTVMNAAKKKERVQSLMAALNMGQIPVLQGTGGVATDYPDISSLEAAKTFKEESDTSCDVAHSSTEFYDRIVSTLRDHDEVEFITLAPPIDLAEALINNPMLQSKVKMIHMLGGWANKDNVCRSTYNWSMMPVQKHHLFASLLQMHDIPIKIYSMHVITPMFINPVNQANGSVNELTCPEIIQEIHKLMEKVPSLRDFWKKAAEAWDQHLVEKVPRFQQKVGAFAGNQFTPADPAVIVAMTNKDFIVEEKAVKVTINFDDIVDKGGFRVSFVEDDTSKHILVTKVSSEQFKNTVIASLGKLADKLDQRLVRPIENLPEN